MECKQSVRLRTTSIWFRIWSSRLL